MKIFGYNLKFKHILAWMVVSIVFQGAVLLFLDKFYFKDNTDVNITQINVSKQAAKTEVHMNIPNDSKTSLVSYNGKFVTYNENNLISIANTSTGAIHNIENLDAENLLKINWVGDRNLLLLLQREENKIVLYNYDPEKNIKQKIINICNYSSRYKDYNIKTSTVTGVIYVRIDNSAYRTDINQTKVTRQSILLSSSSDFFIMPTQDRLVYENLNNYVYLTQPRSRVYTKATNRTTILGIDDDGVTYLGELQNGKVNRIISFSISEKVRSKSPIALINETDPKDIFISSKGNIYINYSYKGIVKEVHSGRETKYDGQFLSFYNDGVTSLVNNKYYKTRFSATN